MWSYDSLPLDCKLLEDKGDPQVFVFLTHITDEAHDRCAGYLLFTPTLNPLSALLTLYHGNCKNGISGDFCFVIPLGFG